MGIQPVEETNLEAAELRKRSELHLAQCEACQKLLSMQMEADRSLRVVSEGVLAERGEVCPQTDSLYKLAEGLLNDRDSEELMKHIVECDHCGPAFRQAVDDLRTDMTPDETATIQSLKSSTLEWQKNLANRLAAGSSKSSQRVPDVIRPTHQTIPFATARWAYALAALLLLSLVAIGGRSIWLSRPSYTERLLGQAYAERRNMEVRIPGALFGPLRFGRGAHVSG